MNTVRTLAKNTSALLAAEAITKVAQVVYFAVLARYVAVGGIGQISTAQALTSTLLVLVSLGFDQLLTRDIASLKSLAASYGTNTAVIKLGLSVIYLLLLFPLTRLLGYSADVVLLVYLYAFNSLFTSFAEIASATFRAFEKMEFTVLTRLLREGTNIILSLIAIFLHYPLTIIVGISVFASFLQVLAGFLLLRHPFGLRFAKVDLSLCKKLLLACLPFAIVSIYPLAQTYLNTLVLSTTATDVEVGHFSAASLVSNTLMLLPSVFMQATFPIFARLSVQRSESLKVTYQKSFNYLLLMGIAVSVGIFLTADRILPLVLGKSFTETASALKVLGWIPAVGFVGYCNGNFLCATGREKLFMITEGCFTVFYAALAVVLTSRFGYMGACYAMLIPTIFGFGFYSILCHKLTGLSIPWKVIAAALLAGVFMALTVQAALEIGVNLLIVILVIAPAIYGISLYVLRAITRDDLSLFKQAFKHG